ncbi:MAG: Hsp20/alpha crystallin family protein [Proteobacteria bacterium]|nr:Hsp20/alpha crystallin family protein [Pseudomonadota bacterium]
MFTIWNNNVERLFNHSLENCMIREQTRDANLFFENLRMNLVDKGDTFEFIAELPGVTEEDILLSVLDDTLTLKASRKIERDDEDNAHLTERKSFSIQKNIPLPASVSTDNVSATFTSGILRVILPRAAESTPRRIPINAY